MIKTSLVSLFLATNFVLLAFCDNLGTLRRYEKAGCEEETLGLSCPQGTSISVEIAQYGTNPRAASTLCPPPHMPIITSISSSSDLPCTPPTSLQYSLLQTVVEACQKKRQCKFQTSTKSFGNDPCPNVQKYVLVAYKCRPYEFRSKVACENDVVQLQCNPNSRIAIYSASYGRTEYESVQCPQPQGVPEETCLVSYATETVMQICHGKRRCTLSADSATFGNPCRKESRMYLKVVFTCVPRRVLREQYEDRPEEDEMLDVDEETDYEGLEDVENNLLPSPNLAGRHNATTSTGTISAAGHLPGLSRGGGGGGGGGGGATLSPSPHDGGGPMNRTTTGGHGEGIDPDNDDSSENLTDYDDDDDQMMMVQEDDWGVLEAAASNQESTVSLINCTLTIVTSPNPRSRVVGFISHWINTYTYLSRNKERLTLYILVSAGGGLILLLLVVAGRLAWGRRRAKQAERVARAEAEAARTLPHPFTDDLSEVDADIDLTLATPVPLVSHHHSPPAAEVVRYSGEGTAPRSLSRAGANSQYYYG